jgi:hypothetical protein
MRWVSFETAAHQALVVSAIEHKRRACWKFGVMKGGGGVDLRPFSPQQGANKMVLCVAARC